MHKPTPGTSPLDRLLGIIYDTVMSKPQIVIDTNVLISALRSRRGASYRLLTLIDAGKFEVNISVPLVLEYEQTALNHILETPLSKEDIGDILDYICRVSNRKKVFYLWRPALKDPKDDMILELAVTAGCDFIVTYNKQDFQGAERFGLEVVTPRSFLERIGELP
jgi:putative PIN family toxin of toxin-antitoxin system